jgi:hypothetical protein
MVKKIRFLLWVKTWYAHLFKLWILRTLGKLALPFSRLSGISNVVLTPSEFNQRSFAVVALFPTADPVYEVSIKNLITGLQNNGLKVVLVLNRNANERLNQYFNDSNCIVINRTNKGRDFGAYKAGVLWLNNVIGLGEIDRLVLANDTLLWLNDGTGIIAKTLNADWSSLFLNLELHTHAQSFFLSFSNRVIQEKKFIKFWNQFVPLNYRRHAILFGEIKLSEILLKEGYRCKPFVNPALLASGDFNFPTDLLESSRIGNLHISEMGGIPMPGVTPGRKNPTEEITPFFSWEEVTEYKSITSDQLKINLIRLYNQYCNSHAPHRIGLHLYVLLGMPMKTDIYKCYPLSEIHRCLVLKNPEYAEIAMDFLSGKSQQFMEGSKENERRRLLSEI